MSDSQETHESTDHQRAETEQTDNSPRSHVTPTDADADTGGGGSSSSDPEPDTSSEWVDPSDGDVQRDADGETIPQVTNAGRLGKVKAKPMAYGTVQKRFGDGRTSSLEAEDLAELFDIHIVKPDLSAHYGGRVTAADVRNMKPLTPKLYLEAIMDVSDVETEEIDMHTDGSADVTVGN